MKLGTFALAVVATVFTLAPTPLAACEGGESKDGPTVGAAIMAAGKVFATGKYSFQNVKTRNYLQIINPGNVSPTGKTFNTASTWGVVNHLANQHSVHIFNNVNHPKCWSARFVAPGCDDANVLYQCEVDVSVNFTKRQTSGDDDDSSIDLDVGGDDDDSSIDLDVGGDEKHLHNSKNGTVSLSKRYPPIRTAKQIWIFLPSIKYKNAYRIVTAAHLFDMTPACVVPLEAAVAPGPGTQLGACDDTPLANWIITKR